MKRPLSLLSALVLLCPGVFAATAVQEGGTEPEYVTVEEFDEAMDELDQLRAALGAAMPGGTGFVLAGWFAAGFVEDFETSSTFEAMFAPVFLWQPSERFLFEGELELGTSGDEIIELEYAQLSFLATDWLTIGAGQFLSPFGIFNERLHPAWINKLPTGPLIAGHDGLVPTSMLGVQARGGVETGAGRVGYALFVVNGPQFNDGSSDPDEAGLLHFDSIPDDNGNKTVGGRIGFQPVTGLEIGGSVMVGEVDGGASTERDIGVQIYGIDLSGQREFDALRGQVRVDSEYVASRVEDTTFDPGGTPFTYDNDRQGVWFQVAYRPTQAESDFLQSLEFVTRYDWLDLPTGAPEEADHQGITCGANYWFGPATVLKVAGSYTHIDDEDDESALLVQLATGF